MDKRILQFIYLLFILLHFLFKYKNLKELEHEEIENCSRRMCVIFRTALHPKSAYQTLNQLASFIDILCVIDKPPVYVGTIVTVF